MAIKVLLINAINTQRRVETNYPPLNLAYLISYVRSRIKNQDIIFKIISNDYKPEIESFAPDIVGISSVTQNYPIAIDIASFCRKKGMPVFIGGVHISTLPSSFDKCFDFGVIGEGEETFFEIVRLFLEKGIFSKAELFNINGLVFLDNNSKLVFTNPRRLIEKIDSIPFPAREYLNLDKNDLFMLSSRGCPYNCYFCSSSSFWKQVRFNSADYVIKEIKQLIKAYNPAHINFYDDLFIADKKRLIEITKRIEKLGINKRVSFNITARANLINKETVTFLKRMNVHSVNMGLESGSEKILKYLKGSNMSVKDNIRAISLLTKAGIRVSGSFVIGAPIDTVETIMETYDFIKSQNMASFAVYTLTPYPKTMAWEYALKNNLVSEHMDFSRLCIDYPSNYSDKIIVTHNISNKELYAFYKKFKKLYIRKQAIYAFKLLFRRPKSVFKNLYNRIKYKDITGYN